MEISTISDSNSYCRYCEKALNPDSVVELTQEYHTECLAGYREFMSLKKRAVDSGKVDISQNQLKKLPSHLKNFQKYLTNLDISQNQISELPTWIGTLSRLSTLKAKNNTISKLSIDNLPKNLRWLDFSYNKIENLPNIDIRPNIINFDFNPLKNIPINWFEDNFNSKILDNWQKDDGYLIYGLKLSFNNCALTSLPDTFSNVNINTLSLQHNYITTLPANLGIDHFLLKIDLSNNPISHLPEHIFEQSNIFNITLNDTKIKYLPDLGSTIRELHLKNTPISEFPDLRNIKEMHLLDIRGTTINKIPAYIKNIKIWNVYIDDISVGQFFGSESNIFIGDSYESVQQIEKRNKITWIDINNL